MARRKKAGSVKVNFKGVESRSTPAEGDYLFKVTEAVSGVSSNKNEQIEVTAEVIKGKAKGFKGFIYFPLQENSLWKLHAFLTALGEEVPEEEMDIDLSELLEKEFVGVLTHETYNGKKRAKLTDFDSVENYTGSDEDEDEDEGKKGKGKKSKPGGKKSKGVSRSAVEEMDEDELEALLEEHDLEDEVDLDDYKKIGKKREAVIEALEEADLLEEDEPEEEEKPKGKKGKGKKSEDDEDEPKGKKGKGGKSKKPKTWSSDDIKDMDEDELEEVLEEAELEDEVDLDDHKKLKAKQKAVIEALEEADRLED